VTTIYLALRKGLCGNAKYQEIPSHFICIELSVPVALFVSHPVCGQRNVFQMIFDFSQCGGAEKRQVSTIVVVNHVDIYRISGSGFAGCRSRSGRSAGGAKAGCCGSEAAAEKFLTFAESRLTAGPDCIPARCLSPAGNKL
jgi:hypothetical protein